MEGGKGAHATGIDEETAFWDKLDHLDREDREEHYRRWQSTKPSSAMELIKAVRGRGISRSRGQGKKKVGRGGGRSATGLTSPFDYNLMEEGGEEEDAEDAEERRGWAPVKNLDLYFQNMYKYYRSKGFSTMVATGVTNLLSMAFTVTLSTWLFAFVDWSGLMACTDELTCQPFNHYVTYEALHRPFSMRYGPVWLYCVLFCLYWCASCYWFVILIKDAHEMHEVYRDRLGISTRELSHLEWHEVLQRLMDKQARGEYRVSITSNVTAKDVACRIMRRENFLIALINHSVLDLRLPLPFLGSENFGTWEATTSREFLTRNLEWSLHTCLLDHMFTADFDIRRDFLSDPDGLKRRFVMVGVLRFLLCPFLLVFMMAQFFLQNAQEWHSKKNYLGPRQWSPLAMWRFREYNELPHLFERRLSHSYPSAMEYQSQASQPVLAVVARCLSYISGSLVAVLLLFTLIDESILLYVKYHDRNLLWYVGIFSALFAMSRSLVPGPEEIVSMCSAEEAMEKVAAYTHYFPSYWKGKCHTYEVREEFLELFQYKVALFFQEILSVVLTPIILCFTLPKCAPAILSFIREHQVKSEELGSVCSYSLFDFNRHGSIRFGAEKDGREVLLSQPRGYHDGKLEKSVLNFKVNYPNWDSGKEGEAFLSRLQFFQEGELEAASTTKPPTTVAHSFLGYTMGGGNKHLSSLIMAPPAPTFGGSLHGSISSSISSHGAGPYPWYCHPGGPHNAVTKYAYTPIYDGMASSFYWLQRYADKQYESNPEGAPSSRPPYQPPPPPQGAAAGPSFLPVGAATISSASAVGGGMREEETKQPPAMPARPPPARLKLLGGVGVLLPGLGEHDEGL